MSPLATFKRLKALLEKGLLSFSLVTASLRYLTREKELEISTIPGSSR